jgi:Ca2+-binding EF-hand superfamily protein
MLLFIIHAWVFVAILKCGMRHNRNLPSLIHKTMTRIEMDPRDEHDIRDSFEILDSDHDGCLSTAEFYSLYLGLGFQPERIQLNDFEQMLELDLGSLLSVDDVLKILSKVN